MNKTDIKQLNYIPVSAGPGHILNHTQVMLDVETLNKTPDSAVWQIGAAIWNPSSPGIVICTQLTLNPGGVKESGLGSWSQDTIDWQWEKNTKNWNEALAIPRYDYTASVEDTTPAEFLRTKYMEFFSQVIAYVDGKVDDAMFWSKSTSFDFPILENLYRQCTHYNLPWKYWNVHELRTFLKLNGLPNKSFSHAAGDDAFNQLNLILEHYK